MARRGSRSAPGKNQQQLARRTEDTISDAQRDFFDRFITEYLIDYNASAAYLRAGGKAGPRNVAQKAYNVLHSGYVAHQLQQVVDNAKEKNLITRNRIIAGMMREANFFGAGASHGARVMSWTGLTRVMGMDTRKIEANLASRGGILIVPATEEFVTWEVRAALAQQALKLTVQQ